MIHITDIPGRRTLMDGKPYLFFSGFAYLGMPSLEVFQDAVSQGVRRYGAVYPSSRLSNTPFRLYDEFERELAALTGREAALSFSSGYLAAQAAVRASAGEGLLLYGPRVHPSLHPSGAPSRSFTSSDWEQELCAFLRTVPQQTATGTPAGMPTIVLESVDPISGVIRDFSWLLEIDRPVRVLIDDSHGIGVLGDQGEGITSLLPVLPELTYLICFSLSKAFSCQGGAVVGSLRDITRIRSGAQFRAATPMSPAFVYGWMESRPVFDLQRERLRQNLAWLRQGLATAVITRHDPRLPFCRVVAPDFYAFCLKNAILLSAFSYPAASDPAIVRAVINALHTREDLDTLIGAVYGYEREMEAG